MHHLKNALVKTLCAKLKKIKIYECGLDDNCVFELSDAIRIASFSSIKWINLRFNKITKVGLKSLTYSLIYIKTSKLR